MRKTLFVVLLAALAIAPAAQAGTTQESIFQDDNVLLSAGSGQALTQLQGLGVNTIHTLVFWTRLAPNVDSKTKPSGDLTNPNTYSAAAWAPYDALVRGAAARGIQVLMTPTGFTPRWAECKRPPTGIRNCTPNAKYFQDFVTAVGKRYSGTFTPPGGTTLPRVSRWSIWNEPDQIGWIYPQKKGSLVVGAKYYRDVFYAGQAGLKKSGHSRDKVLLGETAPTARGRSTDPTSFLLALFCVNNKGKRIRTAALGCNKFKKLKVAGYAHHPYNTSAIGPALRKPKGKGDITLAVIGRLKQVLALGAKGRSIPRNLPVYFTEYGIQSNPPNPSYGVPLTKQAMWLNQMDFTAYNNKQVKAVSQYELVDDGNDPSVFQTGLEFQNGSPKPSLDAYRLPIWVTRKGGSSSIWFWVRPAGGSAQTVQIQHDTGGGFQTVATKTTNGRGFAKVSQSGTSGTWRIAWKGRDGNTYLSRSASVNDR